MILLRPGPPPCPSPPQWLVTLSPPPPPASGAVRWFGIWVSVVCCGSGFGYASSPSAPRGVVWFAAWVALGVSKSPSSSSCSCLGQLPQESGPAILVTVVFSMPSWHSPGWKVSTVTRIGCVWDEILVTVDALEPVEKCAQSQGVGIWAWRGGGRDTIGGV